MEQEAEVCYDAVFHISNILGILIYSTTSCKKNFVSYKIINYVISHNVENKGQKIIGLYRKFMTGWNTASVLAKIIISVSYCYTCILVLYLVHRRPVSLRSLMPSLGFSNSFLCMHLVMPNTLT